MKPAWTANTGGKLKELFDNLVEESKKKRLNIVRWNIQTVNKSDNVRYKLCIMDIEIKQVWKLNKCQKFEGTSGYQKRYFLEITRMKNKK